VASSVRYFTDSKPTKLHAPHKKIPDPCSAPRQSQPLLSTEIILMRLNPETILTISPTPTQSQNNPKFNHNPWTAPTLTPLQDSSVQDKPNPKTGIKIGINHVQAQEPRENKGACVAYPVPQGHFGDDEFSHAAMPPSPALRSVPRALRRARRGPVFGRQSASPVPAPRAGREAAYKQNVLKLRADRHEDALRASKVR